MKNTRRKRKKRQLSSTTVKAIRTKAGVGGSYDEIARHYGITAAHVGRIVRGEVWPEAAGPVRVEPRNRRRGLLVKPGG